MLLVLMDNATAEYTFISVFFAPKRPNNATSVDSPAPSPHKSQYVDDDGARRPSLGSEILASPPMRRRTSLAQSITHAMRKPEAAGDLTKEDLAIIGQTWKQVMDPSLNYCQVRHGLLSFVSHSTQYTLRRLQSQFSSRVPLSFHC